MNKISHMVTTMMWNNMRSFLYHVLYLQKKYFDLIINITFVFK